MSWPQIVMILKIKELRENRHGKKKKSVKKSIKSRKTIDHKCKNKFDLKSTFIVICGLNVSLVIIVKIFYHQCRILNISFGMKDPVR